MRGKWAKGFGALLIVLWSLLGSFCMSAAADVADYVNGSLIPRQQYSSYLSPAYIRNNVSEETVNEKSGELNLVQTDYVLEGVNGLNVELKRIYKSELLNPAEMSLRYESGVWIQTLTSNHTTSSSFENYYNLGMGWRFSFPFIEYRSTKSYDAAEDAGAVSSRFLHLDSGDVYELTRVPNSPYKLEGHPLQDLVVEDDTDTNGYKMTEKNGTKTFFNSSGQIIKKQDRYGNKIEFTYQTHEIKIEYAPGQYYEKSKSLLHTITDTAGRVFTFSYHDGILGEDGAWLQTAGPNADYSVTVTLPHAEGEEGQTIVYRKEPVITAGGNANAVVRTALSTVIDRDQKPKQEFTYTSIPADSQDALWFRYNSAEDAGIYTGICSLAEVLYCRTNQVQTFDYKKGVKRLNVNGISDYRQIKKIAYYDAGDRTTELDSVAYTYHGAPGGFEASGSSSDQEWQTTREYKFVKPEDTFQFSYERNDWSPNIDPFIPLWIVNLEEQRLETSDSSTAVCILSTQPNIVGMELEMHYAFSLGSSVFIKIDDQEPQQLPYEPVEGTCTLSIPAGSRRLSIEYRRGTNPGKYFYIYSMNLKTTVSHWNIRDYSEEDPMYLRNSYTYKVEKQYANGKTVEDSYTSAGRLRQTITTASNTQEQIQYTYDDNGMLTGRNNLKRTGFYSSLQTNISTENYVYDDYGNLLEYTSPNADWDVDLTPKNDTHTTFYTYDTEKYHVMTSKRWKQDADTLCQTSYQLDNLGNVLQESTNGLTTSYTYYPNGQLASKTEKVSTSYEYYDKQTFYEYAEEYGGAYLTRQYAKAPEWDDYYYEPGVVIEEQKYTYNFFNGTVSSSIDGNGNATLYDYDALSRLTKVQLPEGQIQTYAYTDCSGQEIPRSYVDYTDANGNTFRSTFDARGQLTKKEHLYEQDGIVQTTLLSSYRYDTAGNVSCETDANGNYVEYGYDGLGRLIQTAYGSGSDPDVREEKIFTYSQEEAPVGDERIFWFTAASSDTGHIHSLGFYYTPEKRETYEFSFDYYLNTWYEPVRFPYNYGLAIIGGIENLPNSEDDTDYVYAYADIDRQDEWVHFTTQITLDPTEKIVMLYPFQTGSLFGGDIYYKNVVFKKLGSEENLFPQYENLDDYPRKNVGGNSQWRYLRKTNNVVTQTDELGFTTTEVYDQENHLLKRETTPDNETFYTESFAYDAVGNCVKRTDARGNETTFSYDAKNRQIEEVQSAEHSIQTSYTTDGRVITQEEDGPLSSSYESESTYDSAGRMLESYHASDSPASHYNYQVYSYDLAGNVIRTENIVSGSDVSNIAEYEYDGNNRLIRQKNLAENNTYLLTEFTYDGNGNVIQQTQYNELLSGDAQPLGEKYIETTYTYDYANRQTSAHTVKHDGTKTEQTRSERFYDDAGNLIEERQYVSDTTYQSVSYAYDHRGNVIERVENGDEDRAVTYAYDAKGQMISQTYRTGTSSENEEATATTTYDGMGNILTQTDANGQVTRMEYDGCGNLVRLYDPRYGKTETRCFEYEYDARNQLQFEYIRRGGERELVSQRQYDVRNQVIQKTSDDATYETYYTPSGQVCYSGMGNGMSQEIQYDTRGRILSITDQNDRTTTNTYDLLGKLLQTEYEAETATETYSYADPLGWSYTKTDKNGNTTQYQLSLSGQPAKIQYADGGTVEYTYDWLGNPTSVAGPYAPNEQKDDYKTEYTYDLYGNLLSERQYQGVNPEDGKRYARQIEYTYDLQNNKASQQTYTVTNTVSTSQDGTLSYGPDEKSAVGDLTTYTYDALDQLIKEEGPLGREVTYTYDALGNCTQTSVKTGSDPDTHDLSFAAYDLQGNLLSQTIWLDTEDAPEGDYPHPNLHPDKILATTTYSYDPQGRLVQKTDAMGRTESYECDAYYNLPTKITAPDGGVTVNEYDAYGNLTKTTDPLSRVREYTYNPLNLKTQESLPVGENETAVQQYTYDKLGNLTGILYPNSQGQTEPDVRYVYDAMSRKVATLLKNPEEGGAPILQAASNYDVRGNVLKTASADGVHNVYTPDSTKSELSNIADFINAATGETYLYDPVGRLVQKTDAAGAQTQMAYDVRGNLTQTTYANGGVSTSVYDAAGNVTRVNHPDGSKTTYAYDLKGRKIQEIVRKRTGMSQVFSQRYDYTAFDSVARTYDSYDNVSVNRYYPDGSLASQTDPNGNTKTYSYGLNGKVSRIESPVDIGGEASVQQYAYDLAGNLITETAGEGESARVTQHQYDDGNRLNKTTNPAGGITTNSYDKNGNVVQTSVQYAENQYDTTHYVYDGQNRLKQQIVKVDGAVLSGGTPGQTVDRTTIYEYDALGRKTAEYSPLATQNNDFSTKYKTAYSYDAAGRLQTLTRGGDTVTQTVYHYDKMGNPVAEVTEGRYTIYTYDLMGRKLTETLPEQTQPGQGVQDASAIVAKLVAGQALAEGELPATTAWEYDELSNVTKVTDAAGKSTTMEYDHAGRLTKVTNPLGKAVSTKTYDAAGNVLSDTDALGNAVKYAYNGANQVSKVWDQKTASTETPTMQYAYNGFGEQTSQTDALGHTTTFAYSSLGNLTTVTDALSNSISYTYNLAGQKTQMTDQLGAVTQYGRGSQGLLLSETDAQQNAEQYRYDILGRLVGTTDKNGVSVTYTYDARSNLTGKTSSLGDSISYTYDKWDQVSSMTDAAGTRSYTYDQNNRLTSVAKDGDTELEYEYDLRGNLTQSTTQGSVSVAYTYDDAGRMTTAYTGEGSAQKGAQYTYDDADRITNVSYQNGASQGYQYDANGNITQVTLHRAGQGNQIRNYTYDAVGQLLSEQLDGGRLRSYTYDAAGRVSGMQETTSGVVSRTAAYSYDAAGNRLSEIEVFSGEQQGEDGSAYTRKEAYYTYDPLGRLASVSERMTGSQTGTTLVNVRNSVYDRQGNEIYREFLRKQTATGGAGELHTSVEVDGMDAYDPYAQIAYFGYNGFNQMSFAQTTEDGVRTEVSYVYNGEGRRAGKTTQRSTGETETIQYLYSGDKLIRETGSQTKDYLLGATAYIGVITSDTASYFLYNAHGDVVEVTNAGGEAAYTYTYGLFGTIESTTDESGENAIRYGGEYYDVQTELYYLGTRYYDASTGRYTQADFYRAAEGDLLNANRYVYAANNPLRYTDPTGMFIGYEYTGGRIGYREGEVYAPSSGGSGGSAVSYAASSSSSGSSSGTWTVDGLDRGVGSGALDPHLPAIYRPTYTDGSGNYYTPSYLVSSGRATSDQYYDYLIAMGYNTSRETAAELYKDWWARYEITGGPVPVLRLLGPVAYDERNPYVLIADTVDDGQDARYAGYVYTVEDAIEWLKQTGGKVNFVLLIRDVVMGDLDFNDDDHSNWPFDVETFVNTVVDIIDVFVQASIESNLPLGQLFIGTPHIVATTSEFVNETFKSIYEGIQSRLGQSLLPTGVSSEEFMRDYVGGIYYGREDPYFHKDTAPDGTKPYDSFEDIVKNFSSYVHEDLGKPLLWMPYMRNDEQYYNIAKAVNTYQYEHNGVMKDVFDVVILQPALFYYAEATDGKYMEDTLDNFRKRLDRIESSLDLGYVTDDTGQVIVDAKPDPQDPTKLVPIPGTKITNTRIGVEFELDMSLDVGRTDFKTISQDAQGNKIDPPLVKEYYATPAEKRQRLNEVIARFGSYIYDKPTGFYAGGPNELNFRNPGRSNAYYSDKNYTPHPDYSQWLPGYAYHLGRYSPDYDGNLLYDLIDAILRKKYRKQGDYDVIYDKDILNTYMHP